MIDFNQVSFHKIDLEFVKEYLKVDYDDEDILITTIIHGSKSIIETMLGYKISDRFDADEIPTEFTIATLMLCAHWYDQRQIQTTGTLGEEMVLAVSSIIHLHRDHFKVFSKEEIENVFQSKL